ncbi:14182_t:CDS:1, partial [Dentiscutata erythropus]
FLEALDYNDNDNLSKEKMKKMIDKLFLKCDEKAKEITDEKVKKTLNEIDEQRGSWTNEG